MTLHTSPSGHGPQASPDGAHLPCKIKASFHRTKPYPKTSPLPEQWADSNGQTRSSVWMVCKHCPSRPEAKGHTWKQEGDALVRRCLGSGGGLEKKMHQLIPVPSGWGEWRIFLFTTHKSPGEHRGPLQFPPYLPPGETPTLNPNHLSLPPENPQAAASSILGNQFHVPQLGSD